MFQCPVVGVGLLIIGTSSTVGLPFSIALARAGRSSLAVLIFIPSAPYALAISLYLGPYLGTAAVPGKDVPYVVP